MAPELVGLTIADEPGPWSQAGFAVENGQARIDSVTLTFSSDSEQRGIVAWSLTGVDAVSIDGLTTEPARPRPEEGDDADTGAAHPNGSATVDHVVAASPDLPRTIEAFTRIGMETRRIRDTDQYGAPMRQVFFRLGRPVLELIGPPEPSGDRPASFWGLALTVGDLDATKDLLGDRLGDPKTAVQPGRRIATLRHETLGITVPVAFMTS